VQNAEPGIQNIDIARRYSNSDYMYDPSDEYDSRILSTNACSEQYLSRESLCVLASLNVEKFDTSPYEYIPQLGTYCFVDAKVSWITSMSVNFIMRHMLLHIKN
jgi:ribonucleotide reductase alpha subunit